MAYVLGFFAADGNIIKNKRGACYISFYSADKSVLVSIRKVMGSEHKIAKRSYRSGEVYRLQIGSKKVFKDLINLGLIPEKTNQLRSPHIPKGLEGDFVRGYFDGDGNVWSGVINKQRNKPTNVLQVSFTSGSKEFLEDLRILLHRSGIKGGSI